MRSLSRPLKNMPMHLTETMRLPLRRTSRRTLLVWSKVDPFRSKAIQKLWADRFKEVQFSNNRITVDEDSPHI